MSDKYLKVKDNGSSGLAIVRAEAEDVAEDIGIPDLQEQISVQDDRTNDLLGLMNYGYDISADLPKGTSATDHPGKLSVKRNKINILIDGSTTSTAWVCKINNDVQRAAQASTIQALTNGSEFQDGHKYRVTLKKISGSGMYNAEDYIPRITVYVKEGAANQADYTATANGSYSEFTADGSKEYMICVYVHKTASVSNMLVQVTMQDLSDQSVYDMITDLTVPEGTAWN